MLGCSNCGKKINIENATLAYISNSFELVILDKVCFNRYLQFELISYPLKNITWAYLEGLIENCDLSEFDIINLIEKLKLWGLISILNMSKKDKKRFENIINLKIEKPKLDFYREVKKFFKS
ncbi:MAG: hypothetical protein JRJ49_04225 [Deltaproteobacteria bacterium]|nr:hypothetical protein [Deltaproteobacteria bacterium]